MRTNILKHFLLLFLYVGIDYFSLLVCRCNDYRKSVCKLFLKRNAHFNKCVATFQPLCLTELSFPSLHSGGLLRHQDYQWKQTTYQMTRHHFLVQEPFNAEPQPVNHPMISIWGSLHKRSTQMVVHDKNTPEVPYAIKNFTRGLAVIHNLGLSWKVEAEKQNAIPTSATG